MDVLNTRPPLRCQTWQSADRRVPSTSFSDTAAILRAICEIAEYLRAAPATLVILSALVILVTRGRRFYTYLVDVAVAETPVFLVF